MGGVILVEVSAAVLDAYGFLLIVDHLHVILVERARKVGANRGVAAHTFRARELAMRASARVAPVLHDARACPAMVYDAVVFSQARARAFLNAARVFQASIGINRVVRHHFTTHAGGSARFFGALRRGVTLAQRQALLAHVVPQWLRLAALAACHTNTVIVARSRRIRVVARGGTRAGRRAQVTASGAEFVLGCSLGARGGAVLVCVVVRITYLASQSARDVVEMPGCALQAVSVAPVPSWGAVSATHGALNWAHQSVVEERVVAVVVITRELLHGPFGVHWPLANATAFAGRVTRTRVPAVVASDALRFFNAVEAVFVFVQGVAILILNHGRVRLLAGATGDRRSRVDA